jgi:hypothetical protein
MQGLHDTAHTAASHTVQGSLCMRRLNTRHTSNSHTEERYNDCSNSHAISCIKWIPAINVFSMLPSAAARQVTKLQGMTFTNGASDAPDRCG